MFKYSAVFEVNPVDVMLRRDHDDDSVISSRSHTIAAGDFSITVVLAVADPNSWKSLEQHSTAKTTILSGGGEFSCFSAHYVAEFACFGLLLNKIVAISIGGDWPQLQGSRFVPPV